MILLNSNWNWLVVLTHLKNISQNGNLPQIGVKIKHIWNHHPGKSCSIPTCSLSKNCRQKLIYFDIYEVFGLTAFDVASKRQTAKNFLISGGKIAGIVKLPIWAFQKKRNFFAHLSTSGSKCFSLNNGWMKTHRHHHPTHHTRPSGIPEPLLCQQVVKSLEVKVPRNCLKWRLKPFLLIRTSLMSESTGVFR